ncbi:MAG: hypothetical protein L0226_14615 [Acidobacteria bacterium]|nr:hypothetical protein [Acidobacteriota bacterium]
MQPDQVISVAKKLWSAIPHCHTNSGRYDQSQKVSAETLQSLKSLISDEQDVTVFWFTNDYELSRIGNLVVQATEAIIADHDQSHDSAKWYRFDWDEVGRHRDGITLDAMGGSALLRAAAKILPRQSQEQNDQFWLKATHEVHTATASLFGIIAVRDQDNLAQRMRCGRAWQRIHLWATM